MRYSFIRITAVALLLFSLWSLSLSFGRIKTVEGRIEELNAELFKLRSENRQLKKNITEIIDGESMEKLARDKLGFVMPGEKIFCFDADAYR